MSLVRIILLCLFAASCMCSCEPTNIERVKASIQVVDATTGQPIPNAAVLMAAVYDRPGMGTANGQEMVQTTTDAKGRVSSSFEQGFRLGAVAQARGYVLGREQLALTQQRVLLTIALRRARPNPTLISQLYFDLAFTSEKDFKDLSLDDSLRVTIGEDVEVKVDYCYADREDKMPDSYGVILAKRRASRDTAACDFWLEPAPPSAKPSILVAGGKGGIIPILNNQYSCSILLDFDQAPAAGYQRRYMLTGKERGFFIRTRDGLHFGKYVLAGNSSAFSMAAK